MDKEELKRYNRQIILSEIGLQGQTRLKEAKVLVIGAGGLGCPALQYLAAAGVGTIGIVDHDVVDESNLHRQILYSVADIGKKKAEAASEKLKALNPFIAVNTFSTRLEANNAEKILESYHIVVDGSDNFETRYLVNDACVKLNKTLVFGSIFGFEGQISVFNHKGGPTYRCLFPEAGQAPNCEVNGVLGVLPGIVGSYMANEVLKLILGIGEPLSGKLLLLNVLDNSSSIFTVKRTVPASQANKIDQKAKKSPQEEIKEMPFSEMETRLEQALESDLVIDVREPQEYEADDLGALNVPLSDIPGFLKNRPKNKNLIFYCNSGKRSKTAAELALQAGITEGVYWVKR